MARIRVGDQVEVVAGKERGKRGEVLRILLKTDRVVVRGLNMVKKHKKPNQQGQGGGIVSMEAPIHVSNVMPIDPSSGKPTRVGKKITEAGTIRIGRKTGAEIPATARS